MSTSPSLNLDNISALSADEGATYAELASMALNMACESLGMIVSQSITATITDMAQLDSAAGFTLTLPGLTEVDCSAVLVRYTKGVPHETLFVVPTASAKMLVDMMMMGTGENIAPGPLSELENSAVSEAFSQMFNAAAIQLTSMLNDTLEVAAPEVMAFGPEALGKITPPALQLTGEWTLANGKSIPLIQVISVAHAQALVGKMLASALTMEEPAAALPASPSVSAPAASAGPATTVQPVQFTSFDQQPSVLGPNNKNLDLVLDVGLNLTVQLGTTELNIKQVLELTRGSVVELDRVAGEPVDLLANGKLIAKGEVVVIEDNFGLRITSIVSPQDRLRGLNG